MHQRPADPQRFDFEIPERTQLTFRPRISLRPKGTVPLRVRLLGVMSITVGQSPTAAQFCLEVGAAMALALGVEVIGRPRRALRAAS